MIRTFLNYFLERDLAEVAIASASQRGQEEKEKKSVTRPS